MDWVGRAWEQVFMTAPATWGLALALGELVLALFLLRGGPPARLGWTGTHTWISIETAKAEDVSVGGFVVDTTRVHGKARLTLLRAAE